MKKTLCFILLSIFLFGCAAKHENAEHSTLSADNKHSINKIDTNDRKLIKNGYLQFQTNDVEKTNELIKITVNKFGAYISVDNKNNSSSQIGYDLTIRVPAIKFDSLMSYILEKANIKQLNNKSTQINDVTDDFIDTQARIKIKKESEQKLIELLKQAKNLTEVLEIQKQLTDLRTDIESTEGHMKYIADQVDYSTINVSFYEKTSYSNIFLGDFWNALKDGWQVTLHIFTFLAYLWVIILGIIVGRWGYKIYIKHYKNKNNAA